MSIEFRKHKMQWTPESIGRFWDNQSSDNKELYFSYQVGDSILAFLKKNNVTLRGNIVDYGCGPGFLLEKLIKQNIQCEGLDYSEDSVEKTRQRLSNNTLFKGVQLIKTTPSPLADNYCDAIFFIETIEHLMNDMLQSTLQELYRVTAPGGYVIVTTPNDQDLEAGELLCPECGCQYHHMQHVQSWNKGRITKVMESFGFNTYLCTPTLFRYKVSKLDWLRDIYANLRNHPNQHLIYIGQKPTA